MANVDAICRSFKIDVTCLESARVEYLDATGGNGGSGSGAQRFTRRDDSEAWYRERKQVYGRDYSSSWFDASKVALLVALILIFVDLLK